MRQIKTHSTTEVGFYKLSLLKAAVVLLLFHFTTNAFAQHDSTQIIDYLKKCNETYYANPDSSYEFCLRAEKESKYQGNFNFAGDIALGKARYHILVTDYELAFSELSFAIDFFEQKRNYPKLSSAYSLKSILLDRIGEHDASSEMLKKAYQISKENNDRQGEISRLINLSLDFIDRKQADSAYKYLLILESLGKDIQDDSRYFLEQNLGLYYHLIEDYTKAVYYYNRALNVAEKFSMTDSKATILARLSESYRKLKMYDLAERTGVESFNLSVKFKLVFEERDAIEQLILLYDEQNNFKSAYEFRGKLIAVDEKINKIEKVQKLKEDEYKLNIAQKEAEIAEKELTVQNEKLKAEESRSQNLRLYFLLSLITVVLISLIIIYRRTTKLNKAIALSKIILEQKNKEVLDSIKYAKQIQDAILPPKRYYTEILNEAFIFYRPKDIVAGDFYWVEQVDHKIYFAVADCTGHGVPGAMVSVICHTALNRSLKEFGLEKPGDILEKTSELVQETFSKSDREVKDGMDIALCMIDTKTNILQFAGANNPVWIVKNIQSDFLGQIPAKNMLASENSVLIELRGNRQPIGYFERKQVFINQSIQLEKNDTVYLSSDGYFDQFGGDKGKKIKSRAFKEKLLQVQNSSIQEQYELLVSLFDGWKGDFEQTDDVCVMGFKLNEW